MKIDFKGTHLAVLLKAFYESNKDIPDGFITENFYQRIAMELDMIVDDWSLVGIDFVDWCTDILLIYPYAFLSEEYKEEFKKNQLNLCCDGILATGWLGTEIKR